MLIPIISIPKSGTYFLNEILKEYASLTGKSFVSEFSTSSNLQQDLMNVSAADISCFLCHWPYSSGRYKVVTKYKPIFLYRHPMEIAVSFIEGALKNLFNDDMAEEIRNTKNKTEMYRKYLYGVPSVDHGWASGLDVILKGYLGWLHSDIYSISYTELYNLETNNLSEYLGLETYLTYYATNTAINKGRSMTFRKGEAGNWRIEMPLEVQEEYVTKLQGLITKFGFEIED